MISLSARVLPATALLIFSYYDFKFRRIPNVLIFIFTCMGAAVTGPGFYAAWAKALIVSIGIYMFSLIGAGDLKVCCFLSGCLGTDGILNILFITSIIYVTVQGLKIIFTRKTEEEPMVPYILSAYIIAVLQGVV